MSIVDFGAAETLAAATSTTRIALTSLFVVCIVAAIVPILSQLLPDKPPQVVLPLLGGIIVGPSVLNLARPGPVELLSDLGAGFPVPAGRVRD
jgi:Kef-type K+ transport system membrane component KefB